MDIQKLPLSDIELPDSLKKRRGVFSRYKRWLLNRTITRWKYGCNPEDTWSLDYSLAKWIIPRLKCLKDVKNCYPGNLESIEEWDNILDRIIKGFELIIQDVYGPMLNDQEFAEMNEGLDLFRKYIRDLWW